MFFKAGLTVLFFKFLWIGLIFGIIGVVAKFVVRVLKKNVYITNFVCFVFWLLFGFVFARICFVYYNYSFCWFGLLAMMIGIMLVKISIEFFLDYLLKFFYNYIVSVKKGHKDGKLQTNKKI